MTEREYSVPLRKAWLKAPRYTRAKKAVRALKAFVTRHMKVKDHEQVKICRHVNETIWHHGIKNPPAKVNVHVKREDDLVLCELQGKPFPVKTVEKVETGLAGKLADKITGEQKPAVAPSHTKDSSGSQTHHTTKKRDPSATTNKSKAKPSVKKTARDESGKSKQLQPETNETSQHKQAAIPAKNVQKKESATSASSSDRKE